MSRKLIIRNLATQDLRQQANYILSNGSAGAAEQFLELAEATFAQILTVLWFAPYSKVLLDR